MMKEQVNLDLEGYFNNKSIIEDKSCIDNVIFENRSMANTYLISCTLPNSNEKIMVKDISYTFPDKSIGKMDNITCENQIISVPKGKYQKAGFLACGELESYLERIIFIYDDGCRSERQLFIHINGGKIYNIWDYVYKKDLNIAVKGKDLNENDIYLFSVPVPLEFPEKTLCTIMLPNNPLVHIFAITLSEI